MFDRKADVPEGTGTSVVLTLNDGTELKGRIAVSAGRAVADALNSPAQYIEFEEYAGVRTYLAKHSIASIRLINPPRGQSLPRMRDTDGFDPHQILGLPLGAPFEDVRAAYIAKAKLYHPDRYSSAELPNEVRRYLDDMSRRINAAFEALQGAQQSRKVERLAPVYTSPAR
jgi:hypothetical protein